MGAREDFGINVSETIGDIDSAFGSAFYKSTTEVGKYLNPILCCISMLQTPTLSMTGKGSLYFSNVG